MCIAICCRVINSLNERHVVVEIRETVQQKQPNNNIEEP